jgi:cytochrome c oxidase subunit IV
MIQMNREKAGLVGTLHLHLVVNIVKLQQVWVVTCLCVLLFIFLMHVAYG